MKASFPLQFIFVMVLLVCLCGGTLAAVTNTPVAPGVLRVGTVRHRAINEGSGLAASRHYPGVIWTHNDSGAQFLFAINMRGEMLGAFQVTGANLIDWEDIAADDTGHLYLADIGTNGMFRTHVAVHKIKEPNPNKRYGNARAIQTWYLKFPGALEDCESFFVDRGYGYLVTKRPVNGMVTMYRYSLANRARSITLQVVTRIPINDPVTAADVSIDRRRLGLVTSDGVHVFFILGNVASAGSAAREFTRFDNDFMEGGTFFGRNFLASAETRQLWLFVNPDFRCPTPPRFTATLTNQSVSSRSTVMFQVAAEGCPPPRYQWRFNGEVIPGQTGPSLVLSNVMVTDAGQYDVIASNVSGMVLSSAALIVRLKPDVRITEVMSDPAPSPGVPTADWWELTSFESQPISLTGWRFNDSTGGLTDPFVITEPLTIMPGETVVFVEVLSAADFELWWGDINLPPGLQIISYTGSGLSFRAAGDTLYLWDNQSADPNDILTRADFGTAIPGVSFNYDPGTQQFGGISQLGINGVFQAGSAPDIGSPGRIAAP